MSRDFFIAVSSTFLATFTLICGQKWPFPDNMVHFWWWFETGNDFGIFQKLFGPHFNGIFGQQWPEIFFANVGWGPKWSFWHILRSQMVCTKKWFFFVRKWPEIFWPKMVVSALFQVKMAFLQIQWQVDCYIEGDWRKKHRLWIGSFRIQMSHPLPVCQMSDALGKDLCPYRWVTRQTRGRLLKVGMNKIKNYREIIYVE